MFKYWANSSLELKVNLVAVLCFFGKVDWSCEVRVEDFVFSVFSSVLFLEEFHVANTVLVPFIFVEGVIVVDSPLWPVFVKIAIKIMEETFVEIVFVCTIWVRIFSLQNASKIFGVIWGPQSMNTESFSMLIFIYPSQLMS